ncbi:MAG: hypothetical protein AAGD14_11275 [Planctomycetota bacterium]
MTIRIDADRLGDIRALRQILGRLAAGESHEVSLHLIEGLRTLNLDSLTLTLVDVEPEVSLSRLAGNAFRWANTRKGWWACCGLLDGLIEANKPGHHYLTREPPVDDALVEVCLYERTARERG